MRTTRLQLAPAALFIMGTLLATAGGAGAGDGALGLEGISQRLNERIVVSVDPAGSLETFLTTFEADHPDIDLVVLDGLVFDPPAALVPPALEQFFPRRLHLLEVVAPPGADEAFFDALELALETYQVPSMLNGADFDYESEAGEGHTGSTWVDGIAPPAANDQYALTQLGVGAAHLRSRGEGVTVAVLDTGVDATHPFLADRVLSNGYDFIGDSNDTSDVGDGEDTDGDGMTDEMVGHGTFVAGIIGLVAPDANILPVRVLNGDGLSDSWTLARGFYYAINHGVEVINASFGSTHRTDLIEIAIDDAEMLGIPVFAAAGNLNRSMPEEYPAMRHGLGVASLDASGVKSDFSNFSDRLFISAPGGNGIDPFDPDDFIVSTLPGGAYGTWEGTSFASPFVAGAAALLRAQYPDVASIPGGVFASDIAHFIALRLEVSADASIYEVNPQYAPDAQLGAGRADCGAAVQAGPVALVTADINNDGVVDALDYLRLIADWGLTHTPADLNGDGVVDALDFLRLLANWS